MKSILFIICLSIVACWSPIFAYDIKQENALLQQLNVAPNDSTKLSLLYKLVSTTTDEPERSTHYINLLLEEAKSQKNSYYTCQAYLLHIMIAFNMYDVEEVHKWNALLQPVAREAKLYSFMFEGRRAAIDILNTRQQYELVEKEAQKMLKESIELNSNIGIAYAYQSLGYVNAFTFRYNESAGYFEKSYEMFDKLDLQISVTEVCDRLIDIYTILKDYPKRLRAIQKQEKIILQRAKENPSSLREGLLINYLHYLNYYLDTNDLNEAEKYMRLTEENFVKGYLIYEELYRAARISYFYQSQNMERALAEADSLILLSSDAHKKNIWKISKAAILRKMGNFTEALALYKKTWPTKDSLKIDILNQQTEQLKKDYNADALLLRRAEMNYTAQISLITLIAITILVLLWFMIHAYRVQITLSKAEKEQKKLNHDMELANIAKEKFISSISSSIRTPLNSVLKSSFILASQTKLDAEERKLISQTITTTSNELMKLINNILDLSRLEAKMMKYHINRIEIAATLAGMIKSIVAEGKPVVDRIEANKRIWVEVDNNRLIQIIKSATEASRSAEPISFQVELSGKGTVNVVIKESFLATDSPSQEVIVTNEINGMIIADLNGTYKVNSSTGVICITLPIVQIQKA